MNDQEQEPRLLALALGGALGGLLAVLAYGLWLVFR
jgi:hypothetical protein